MSFILKGLFQNKPKEDANSRPPAPMKEIANDGKVNIQQPTQTNNMFSGMALKPRTKNEHGEHESKEESKDPPKKGFRFIKKDKAESNEIPVENEMQFKEANPAINLDIQVQELPEEEEQKEEKVEIPMPAKRKFKFVNKETKAAQEEIHESFPHHHVLKEEPKLNNQINEHFDNPVQFANQEKENDNSSSRKDSFENRETREPESKISYPEESFQDQEIELIMEKLEKDQIEMIQRKISSVITQHNLFVQKKSKKNYIERLECQILEFQKLQNEAIERENYDEAEKLESKILENRSTVFSIIQIYKEEKEISGLEEEIVKCDLQNEENLCEELGLQKLFVEKLQKYKDKIELEKMIFQENEKSKLNRLKTSIDEEQEKISINKNHMELDTKVQRIN